MPQITYQAHRYALEEGETVLECLLRHGVSISYSCQSGVCGSCMLTATAGEIPTVAQAGMKETWKQCGNFLACLCQPGGDLELASPGDVFTELRVRVKERSLLGPGILRLQLVPDPAEGDPASLSHRAGQSLTVVREDGLARPYSIASLRDEAALEIHVRRVRDGRMSGWLHDDVEVGDALTVRGPAGDCFYVPGRPSQPLLLVGTGTGLAPLWGIARDVLAHGHTGPIHLIHGARSPEGLYLVPELEALAGEHATMSYTASVTSGSPPANGRVGDVLDVTAAAHPDLAGTRVYLCGDPQVVHALRRQAFLAGASMAEIHCDAFIMTNPVIEPQT